MNTPQGSIQTRALTGWSLRPAATAWTTICVLLAALFLFPLGAAAQTATTGTVAGTVTDQSGAVVPNAEVQLVKLDTNATATQSTNVAGQYVFLNVAPGNYQITVRMSGFRGATVPNLTVEVSGSRRRVYPGSTHFGDRHPKFSLPARPAAALLPERPSLTG